ncbi:MAG: helix-turn-helix transcriptional regulator [Bacteroides sp.]|nr:helix-turn-helix transcriptional regulator [Bacteroides sp.]MDE6235358.1 XRE family transcriptional regulator [Muribaculaceae bacterium]
MTLKEKYNSLPSRAKSPKAQFIEDLAEKCKTSPTTVRLWVGGRRPDALRRSVISEYLGIPEEELFPC